MSATVRLDEAVDVMEAYVDLTGKILSLMLSLPKGNATHTTLQRHFNHLHEMRTELRDHFVPKRKGQ